VSPCSALMIVLMATLRCSRMSSLRRRRPWRPCRGCARCGSGRVSWVLPPWSGRAKVTHWRTPPLPWQSPETGRTRCSPCCDNTDLLPAQDDFRLVFEGHVRAVRAVVTQHGISPADTRYCHEGAIPCDRRWLHRQAVAAEGGASPSSRRAALPGPGT
jgi:hypothetical protein